MAALGSPAEGGSRGDIVGSTGGEAGGEGGAEEAGGAGEGTERWETEIVGDAQDDFLRQDLELHHSRDGEKTGDGARTGER